MSILVCLNCWNSQPPRKAKIGGIDPPGHLAGRQERPEQLRQSIPARAKVPHPEKEQTRFKSIKAMSEPKLDPEAADQREYGSNHLRAMAHIEDSTKDLLRRHRFPAK